MRYGLPPGEEENDWEPQPDDDDWEGIPSVPAAPAQGTNRIDNFGRASEQGMACSPALRNTIMLTKIR